MLLRLLVALVLGTLGGQLVDQIHVASGTTVYASPDFFGQPWWIGLVFGTGVAAAYLVAQRFTTRIWPSAAPPAGVILGYNAIFLAAYFASALLHPYGIVASAVLWGTLLPRLRARPMLVFALAAAICGTTVEIILSKLGVFHYAGSDFLGVPLWLPALYAHAAPLCLALSRRFPL